MPPRMTASLLANRQNSGKSPQMTETSPNASNRGSPQDPTIAKSGVDSERGPILELLAYFSFIVIFYYMILATIPVDSLAASTQGIQTFTQNVGFTRLNKERGTLNDVSTVDDAVLWTEAMIGAVLTEESYRAKNVISHKATRTPDEHLMLLRVHRLINTIAVSQRRVSPTDCSYEGMKPVYEDCYEHLDDHEVTHGHLLLNDGVTEIPYRAGEGGAKGGFAADLPLDREVALEEFRDLRREGFWDRATREFTLAFAFHNSPGHYTGFCSVLFTMSPYGLVDHSVTIQFLRLRPYSEETNGMLLGGLQATVCVGVLLLAIASFRGVCRQPHIRWSVAHCLRAWFIMDMIMFTFFAASIYYWVSYLNDPTKKKFSFTATKYQSLDGMAAKYGEVMLLQSICLLVCVMRLIEFFGKFKRLQFIVTVLERSSENVAWFCVIFITLFIGFALVGHVLFGKDEENFATIESGVQNLGLWFVALGGGQENLFNYVGGDVFLCLFIGMMMVLLLNFIVTIVMGAYDEVMNEDFDPRAKKPLNHFVADKLCDMVGISKYENDIYNISVRNEKERDLEAEEPLLEEEEEEDQGARGVP